MPAENLPPEVWLRIFRLVPRQDVLNICLVNRKFLSIASSPVLWRELVLSRKKLVENGSSEEFFTVERFNGSRSAKLYGDFLAMHINKRLEKNDHEISDKILNHFIEICRDHKSIKKIQVKNFHLKKVDPTNLYRL